MDPRTRTVIAAYACLVIGVMAGVGLLSLIGVIHNQQQRSTNAAMTGVALVAGAAYLVGLARNRIVFRAEDLQVTRWLTPSRRVHVAEIVARSWHPGGWRRAAYHILYTRDGKEVALPPYLERNAEFQRWIKSIPLRRP